MSSASDRERVCRLQVIANVPATSGVGDYRRFNLPEVFAVALLRRWSTFDCVVQNRTCAAMSMMQFIVCDDVKSLNKEQTEPLPS